MNIKELLVETKFFPKEILSDSLAMKIIDAVRRDVGIYRLTKFRSYGSLGAIRLNDIKENNKIKNINDFYILQLTNGWLAYYFKAKWDGDQKEYSNKLFIANSQTKKLTTYNGHGEEIHIDPATMREIHELGEHVKTWYCDVTHSNYSSIPPRPRELASLSSSQLTAYKNSKESALRNTLTFNESSFYQALWSFSRKGFKTVAIRAFRKFNNDPSLIYRRNFKTEYVPDFISSFEFEGFNNKKSTSIVNGSTFLERITTKYIVRNYKIQAFLDRDVIREFEDQVWNKLSVQEKRKFIRDIAESLEPLMIEKIRSYFYEKKPED